MNTNLLQPGDRLLIYKGSVKHSGTYLGNGDVAHLSPTKGLRVESVREFAADQTPEVKQNGGVDPRTLRERMQQVRAQEARWRLFGNCEHLSNYLETGRAYSPQLRGLVGGAGVALVLASALDIKDWRLRILLMVGFGAAGARLAAPQATAGLVLS